jgi:RNA polymerase-binding transcription factor
MLDQPNPGSVTMAFNARSLKKFKELLLQKKLTLLRKAQLTLGEEIKVQPDELPDEIDQASAAYLSSFSLRLRGREKTFLKKIEYTLSKIEDRSFGVCEECEEMISVKRLNARPEANLCIQCKENQEQREKSLADR